MNKLRPSDYRLTGKDTALAIQNGLAEATWYASPVGKQEMRELLERRDGPAICHALIWFALIIGSGAGGFLLWGGWWAVLPFMVYGVLYGSASGPRWHECGHGTAFKTGWMNNAVYEIASFMSVKNPIRWRWSHARHHSDTIIVGRDPEIAVTRPPKLFALFLSFCGITTALAYFRNLLLNSARLIDPEERAFIPESEHGKVVVRARIHLLIYACVIALSIYTGSILPLIYIGLPALYGGWLDVFYSDTQHAGLAENVLDHRLNCRTIRTNAVNRFLYWNMNYHLEHHMFPLVPSRNLARLHELIQADTPQPYNGLLEAWREIIPTLLRQRKDPTYYIQRELPAPSSPAAPRPPCTSSPPRAGRSMVGSKSAPAVSCATKTSFASTTKTKPTPSTARPTAIFTPRTAFAPTATPIWPTALWSAPWSNAPSTTDGSTSPTVRPGVRRLALR